MEILQAGWERETGTAAAASLLTTPFLFASKAPYSQERTDLAATFDFAPLSPSGVVEYLSTGAVDCTHKDFKELRYSDSLTKFNCNGKNGTSNGMITHGFKLKSAYENGLMPYTNYTFDFKVSCRCKFVYLVCAQMSSSEGGDLCSLLRVSSTTFSTPSLI